MSCRNITLGSCTTTDGHNLRTLPHPPQTCPQVGASRDMQTPYDGPFINVAQTLMSPDLVHSTHTQGLADLSRSAPPPDVLDWRVKGGDQIEDGSRNQGNCGSCWAMASTSVLGDRYALKYLKQAPYPSAAWTVMCLNQDYPGNSQCSCGGNNYVAACKFRDKGIGLEECYPFSLIGDNAPSCPNFGDDCCAACCGPEIKEKAQVKFTASKEGIAYLGFSQRDDVSSLDPDITVRAIQQDIHLHGPVLTSFMVPKDWSDWFNTNRGTDKIYIPTSDDYEGGHSVVIVGWGREDSTDKLYWILRNSWGLDGSKKNSGFCNMMASYDPKNQKTQIPTKFHTGLDIPKSMTGGSFAGGCVTFLPGKRPKWSKWADSKGAGSLPKSDPGGITAGDVNWGLLMCVMGILLILLLIYLYQKLYRKRGG